MLTYIYMVAEDDYLQVHRIIAAMWCDASCFGNPQDEVQALCYYAAQSALISP